MNADTKKLSFTASLLLSFLFAALFFALGLTVKHTLLFDALNKTTLDFLIHRHTHAADIFFVGATLLCQHPYYFPFGVVLAVWLGLHRHWLLMLIFLLTAFIAYYAPSFFKHFFEIARPSENIVAYGYAYPSGHTLLAGVAFGFWSLVFTQHLTGKKKYWVMLAYNLPALVIAFSRLYLGVHWVTDVIGGFLLAWVIVTSSFSVYSLVPSSTIKPDRPFYILMGIAFAVLVCLMYLYMDETLTFYTYIAHAMQNMQ